MEVRFIKPEEAADFLKVSSTSFIWKFDEKVDDHVDTPVLAVFDNGKLISGLEAIDFECNYCGTSLGTIGIGCVCCLPEARRMGAVRAMFDKIGETALEHNWTLGFLHPFSIEYYEQFGYGHLNQLHTIKVPFTNLNHIPRNTNGILYTGEQFEELSALHNKCVLLENLLTYRKDKKCFCDKPHENTDYTYFRRNEKGEADAYVRFTVSRPNTLSVDDLYFLTPEALFGILGFLRNYDGIVKELIIRRQYQGSPYSLLADRISGEQYSWDGCMAARIYDIKKVLESNIYPEEHGSFRIKSIDKFEQNCGIFEVEYENGKGMVTKHKDGKYDISLEPHAAARLLLAGESHNAFSASFLDGVELNGDAKNFFKSFPNRPTRFTDSF